MKLFKSKQKKENDNFFKMLEKEIEETYEHKKKTSFEIKGNALTPDEVLSSKDKKKQSPEKNTSPMEALKNRMINSGSDGSIETDKDLKDDCLPQSETEDGKHEREEALSEDAKKEDTPKDASQKTLLEKCRPYTLDEHGEDVSKVTRPLYELETVAQILRSDGEKTLRELSKKYNISIEDLSSAPSDASKQEDAEATEQQIEAEKTAAASQKEEKAADEDGAAEKTPAFKKMVADAEKIEKKKTKNTGYEDVFKKVFSSDKFGPIPDISDIDNEELESKPKTVGADTATVRFTPIKTKDNKVGHISVKSVTKEIDITGEFEDIKSGGILNENFEENDFDLYSPETELKNPSDTKKILRKLSIKKRSFFLRCCCVGIITAVLATFLLPPIASAVTGNTKISMIVCTVLFALATLCNLDMFLSFKNIISRKCTADILSAITSLAIIGLGIFSVFENKSSLEIILTGSIILFSRALGGFLKYSALIGNLKQLIKPGDKNAVALISDNATTFAMAKNSIEGDSLIAAPRKIEFAEDFMKFSTFGTPLKGRLIYPVFLGFLLAAVTGLAAYSYFGIAIYGLQSAATILCLCTLPSVFFIDVLSDFCAAAKLNKKGSMIFGKTAAEKIELANAAVISTADIFPSGNVTLFDMKVLNDNDVDKTLMRAASLTDALSSPLAPIFKEIAGTNDAYSIPDSDTVKYEERLGISGWVDNELLFIGNRTLMEAHGIPVPSIEIDRKILRSGYFPVYVASGGDPYALIIIQYTVNPNVAKELGEIISSGVTLLIDNCDPNINEEMICDYFGIYRESVKVMTNAGVHMYKNAVTPAKSCSSPAVFRGNPLNLISIVNCASNIKNSNTLLSICYAILSVLGVVIFIYSSFSGGGNIPSGMMLLLYQLVTSALSLLVFLIKKP